MKEITKVKMVIIKKGDRVRVIRDYAIDLGKRKYKHIKAGTTFTAQYDFYDKYDQRTFEKIEN